MSENRFDRAAATWDDNPHRGALTSRIAETILHEAPPTAEMDVLDYGCGTGTLGRLLLPYVGSVTGADNSVGMLEVLAQRIAADHLGNMSTLHLDLQSDPAPAARFDFVVSAMALHHIRDTTAVIRGFGEMLRPGGTVCLADLDTEPGTFHGNGAPSVFHHGFDRDALLATLAEAGFVDARTVTAATFEKPDDNGQLREYSVFLAVAHKPGQGAE